MDKVAKLFELFQEQFGYPGESKYFSPGRINLIGDHTDYNGGKVFPSAISMGTYAVVGIRNDKSVRAYSGNFPNEGVIEFSLEDIRYQKESGWTNYIKGMLLYIQESLGELDQGFDIYVYGTIPNGASLSSSASLEVLIGIIANDIYHANLDGRQLALLGMRVENEFLGLNSGIMDQFIIANARENHALLLDTNTLTYRQVPLDLTDHKIVIMNSMTKRELVTSAYNERRQQCDQALAILNESIDINNLGQLSIADFDQYGHLIKDPVLRKRAKHAVYENERTEMAATALEEGNLIEFGRLMNESHLSLHEDYEVTVRETDLLVRTSWLQEGVVGARMTGGGFGGCCIALVANNQIGSFLSNVGAEYENEVGFAAEFYIAESSGHAEKL